MGPGQLAFLVGVPLAWAVLLWFHPDVPDPDNVYGGLRDEVTTYQIVRVGTLVFIGLMGVALYKLVRDLPGKAATITRLAIGPFVVFYSAWETVIGLATGALVQHANDSPAGQRPAVSDAIQALADNTIVGEMGVLSIVGGLAWITAVIAASVAVRRAGAPVLATVLLGLSLVVVSHPPPIGPVGLACFAGAVVVLYSSQRATRRGQPSPSRPRQRSQRRSGPRSRRRVTEILRVDYGYEGSVDLVKKRLARMRTSTARPAQRTGYRPGQVLQLDWAEMSTRPKIAGRERRVYALIASLPFSGAQTAHFSFDLTAESFLEGHVRALEWLGGVPRECV